MNQITTIKNERIDVADVLIVAKLKTFIINSNFDSWKFTILAYLSGLYFPAKLLANQCFLRFYNYSLYMQTYNI